MARMERLLDLVHILRAHRYPVTATVLAEKLAINARTIYRDIANLRSMGAEIKGTPRVGYTLISDPLLPPLMFSQQEIDALVLGLNWVALNTDTGLKAATRSALTKLYSVIPEQVRHELDSRSLLIGPSSSSISEPVLSDLLRAIHDERKIDIQYEDKKGQLSTRCVWPLAISFMASTRLLAGWCELRNAFRHFRLDKIICLEITPVTYPGNRAELLRKWKSQEGVMFFDES